MAVSIVNRNIRFLRRKMGMNQEGFAMLMGAKSRGMVSHYERGRIEPQNHEIMAICRHVRVTMDELVGIDFENTNYRYLDSVRTLSKQRKNG